jgi:VCBS repeat-containing protein
VAGVLIAALFAFMGSAGRPGAGLPMERTSFRGGAGYWLLAKDGGVFAFGDAKFYGPNRNQGNDIAGMAATATGLGYWTVDDDGDVFNYGDARDYGSRPGPEVDDIVGFTARSQGDGYWMVARDGAVYAFGAAQYFGSANTLKLTKPIVGMASTPSGKGYWLIAGDGGVFAYGDAQFFGSTGAIKLAKPIIDFGPSPDGNGYRFIGSDGGVFSFGSAPFFGSTGAMRLNQPIVGFATTATGNGYWLVGQDGGVFSFGDATFYGSTGGIHLNAPIVAMVATPRVKVAPIANADTATVDEDSSVTIPVEDNDTHALPASVSINSAPGHGTATMSGTKVVYTPAANYNGSDSFTYKLTDTVGHSATGTITVTVKPVKDPPTASGSGRTTAEDTPLTGTLAASDADGDTLTFSKTDPAHGTVSVNASTGAFTYTPAANYNGPDGFTFKVNDGTFDSNTATVSITVTAVNDAPTASNASRTTAEDTAISGTLAASDVDGDTLTFSKADPAHGTVTVNASTGAYTYTPAANYHGPDSFTFKVNDGTVDSGTATVSITVTPVNDAPVASDGSATTPKNLPLSDAVTAIDVDGDDLTYAHVPGSGPSDGGLAFLSDGTFTYTPDPGFHGTDSFDFTANDGTVDSGSATFTITVNSAPAASDGSDSTAEDTPLTGNLTATDLDLDSLTYSKVTDPAHGSVTVNANGSFSYTPAANYNGPDSFTFKANDGFVNSNTATFSITVVAVNDAPSISNIVDQTIAEDATTGALSFTVNDVETPAGSLTVSGSSSNTTLVPNGNIFFGGAGSSRTVTVTPAANQNGSATITVTVSDGLLSGSDTFLVTVNAVNDAPSVSDISDQTIAEDTNTGALSFTVGDVETSDLVLTVSGTSSNQGLVPNGNITFGGAGPNRTVTVTPVANQNGSATITVTVSDGQLSTSDTFVVTVSPVNDAPFVSDIGDQTIAEDTNTGALTFTVSDVETAAGSLTVSGTSSSTTLVPNGNIVFGASGASRTVTVTPAPNKFGVTTITVTVSDGSLTASDTFQLTVSPQNDDPVISEIVDQGLVLGDPLNVSFTVGDADGDSVTVTAASSDDAVLPDLSLLVTDNGGGSWSVSAVSALITGPTTITITADDGNGGIDTETFLLTVM